MTELIFCPPGRQGDYVIPDTVFKIGKKAFMGCTGLTAITIPNSVTQIESSAFESCAGLTSVIIPASVTIIRGSGFWRSEDLSIGVFGGCPAIISIHPENRYYKVENGEIREIKEEQITNISVSVTLTQWLRLEHALKRAGVKKPALVTRLTVAGTFAERDFRYISENMAKTLQELDLSKATIKKNRIPYFAFSRCFALISIVFSDTVQSIDRRVFYNCAQLTSITVHPENPYYTSDSGVLFNKEKTVLVQYQLARQGDYVIPASVTKIDIEAFRDCTGLTSVTIPPSVTEIEYGAFYGCTGLTSVTIPSSVTEIGYSAFYGCPAFFTAHPDNPCFTSVEGVLSDKTF